MIEDSPADAPLIGTLEANPDDAWSAIDAFSKEGRLRVAREGRVLVFVHPAAVGVLIAAEPAAITQLRLPANVLPAVTGTDDFAVPDGLWIAADGSVLRRGAGR